MMETVFVISKNWNFKFLKLAKTNMKADLQHKYFTQKLDTCSFLKFVFASICVFF